METRYHPGVDEDFVVYMQLLPWENKKLIVFEGKMRWLINKDGEEYILRPESQKPKDV